MMFEKKIEEVKFSIDKRQKELEEAYEKWEKDQYRKSIIDEAKPSKKDKKDCIIY